MKKLRVTCEIHDEGKRARKMKNRTSKILNINVKF